MTAPTFTKEQLADLLFATSDAANGPDKVVHDVTAFALALLDRAENAEAEIQLITAPAESTGAVFLAMKAERDRLRAQLDSILANSQSLESGKLADAHAENKRLREELAEAEEAIRRLRGMYALRVADVEEDPTMGPGERDAYTGALFAIDSQPAVRRARERGGRG